MANTNKLERIDDEIMKELNNIICLEMKDPRLSTMVSVVGVNTAKDLKTADVFVSIMDDAKAKEIMAVLNNASGYIRGLLFERLKIRLVPHLLFKRDTSIAHSFKIDSIIKELHKNDENL